MTRKLDRKQLIWPVAMAALIFFASSRSRVAGPEIAGFDKLVHFLAYGLLATLVCRLGEGRRAVGWALIAASVFGATDEWHQAFVPGRAPDLDDWIADSLGAALAVTLYTLSGPYRRLLELPLFRRRVAPVR